MMLTKTVDVLEAQPRWQELLSQVLAGEEVILTKDSTPVARLVPVAPRVAGLHAGKIWMSQDFDEPLPDEFWAGNA